MYKCLLGKKTVFKKFEFLLQKFKQNLYAGIKSGLWSVDLSPQGSAFLLPL